VLQMFSHGVIAGLLFAVVGRMVYERTHTRDLDALQAMNLNKAIPFAAVTFTIAGVASMGLPGFSGFVAELQVLVGAWHAFPTLAVIAGVGILVGVAYTLRAMLLAFFGEPSTSSSTSASHSSLVLSKDSVPPISVPERLGAMLLLAAALCIGLYPSLLLDLIVPCFNSPLFQWLPKGGAP